MALRLQQGQIWKLGDEFIRIVHLERLEVRYKTFKALVARKGRHHHTTKKEFCRLIKSAALCNAEILAGEPTLVVPAPVTHRVEIAEASAADLEITPSFPSDGGAGRSEDSPK